jgi:hypothetical protein
MGWGLAFEVAYTDGPSPFRAAPRGSVVARSPLTIQWHPSISSTGSLRWAAIRPPAAVTSAPPRTLQPAGSRGAVDAGRGTDLVDRELVDRELIDDLLSQQRAILGVKLGDLLAERGGELGAVLGLELEQQRVAGVVDQVAGRPSRGCCRLSSWETSPASTEQLISCSFQECVRAFGHADRLSTETASRAEVSMPWSSKRRARPGRCRTQHGALAVAAPPPPPGPRARALELRAAPRACCPPPRSPAAPATVQQCRM